MPGNLRQLGGEAGSWDVCHLQSLATKALKDDGVPVEGGTLVVSGDGRYWNKDESSNPFVNGALYRHVSAVCTSIDPIAPSRGKQGQG